MSVDWTIFPRVGDKNPNQSSLLSLIKPYHHLSSLCVVGGATLSVAFPAETQRLWLHSLESFPGYFTGLLPWGSWANLTVLSAGYMTCIIGRYGPIAHSSYHLLILATKDSGRFAKGAYT